jgi:hypothetical protein
MENSSATQREQVRASIFSAKQLRKVTVEFFGAEIEVRQPTLEDIVETASADNRSTTINTLIRYAYVPGTDERVFDDTDADSLAKLPFDANFKRVVDALEQLTNISFQDKKPG